MALAKLRPGLAGDRLPAMGKLGIKTDFSREPQLNLPAGPREEAFFFNEYRTNCSAFKQDQLPMTTSHDLGAKSQIHRFYRTKKLSQLESPLPANREMSAQIDSATRKGTAPYDIRHDHNNVILYSIKLVDIRTAPEITFTGFITMVYFKDELTLHISPNATLSHQMWALAQ